MWARNEQKNDDLYYPVKCSPALLKSSTSKCVVQGMRALAIFEFRQCLLFISYNYFCDVAVTQFPRLLMQITEPTPVHTLFTNSPVTPQTLVGIAESHLECCSLSSLVPYTSPWSHCRGELLDETLSLHLPCALSNSGILAQSHKRPFSHSPAPNLQLSAIM